MKWNPVPDWTTFSYGLHFFVSAVLVVIAARLGFSRMQAAGAALAIGLMKEIVDVLILHKVGDPSDVYCNIAGVFVGWLMIQ